MGTSRVYLLRLGGPWKVVFPEGRADRLQGADRLDLRRPALRHPAVAAGEPPVLRAVGSGRREQGVLRRQAGPELLQAIREALGDGSLEFAHDRHEKRLGEEVLEFRRLVRRHGATG